MRKALFPSKIQKGARQWSVLPACIAFYKVRRLLVSSRFLSLLEVKPGITEEVIRIILLRNISRKLSENVADVRALEIFLLTSKTSEMLKQQSDVDDPKNNVLKRMISSVSNCRWEKSQL